MSLLSPPGRLGTKQSRHFSPDDAEAAALLAYHSHAHPYNEVMSPAPLLTTEAILRSGTPPFASTATTTAYQVPPLDTLLNDASTASTLPPTAPPRPAPLHPPQQRSGTAASRAFAPPPPPRSTDGLSLQSTSMPGSVRATPRGPSPAEEPAVADAAAAAAAGSLGRDEAGTALMIPEVAHEWYEELSAPRVALLHQAVCQDVAATVAVRASQVRVAAASPDPHGVLVALALSAEPPAASAETAATAAEVVRCRLDAAVNAGRLTLTQVTACLRDLGWFAGATGGGAQPQQQQQQPSQQQAAAAEEIAGHKVERLRLELRAALEEKALEAARAAATRLRNEHPYEGHRAVCDELRAAMPHLTVQDISVRWGDVLAECCGDATARVGPARGGLNPLHHVAVREAGERLAASGEATRALRQHVAARVEKLRLLREADPEPITVYGDELDGGASSCGGGDAFTVYRGEHGKVMATVTQQEGGGVPVAAHPLPPFHGQFGGGAGGGLPVHRSVGATSFASPLSYQYSCSLANDVPAAPFIDYASI